MPEPAWALPIRHSTAMLPGREILDLLFPMPGGGQEE
jgi:hypothetical protein